MLQIQSQKSLFRCNTFGMKVSAAQYAVLSHPQDLLGMQNQPAFKQGILVLGSGSNILFTKDPIQWVIHNQIKGIEKLKEDADFVWLKVGGGEIWHDFTQYCIEQGYCGIENLSLIPGTVGAAPVQNIGAYGVEVKDLIESVHYWDLNAHQFNRLDQAQCEFAYRNSVFKHALSGQTIITQVVFRLHKKPTFHIDYGKIREELTLMGVKELSIRAVSDAVIRIRQSKLPDPKVIGNAGSFFKNPVVPQEHYQQLQAQYPSIPGFTASDTVKIPAAWLIEQCGWKGYRSGDYGVHQHQALVLVNYGAAQGADIARLAARIVESVQEKFRISLDQEVRIC